jgi:hypothetical protein
LMERENIPLTKPIVYYAIIGGGIVIAASAFAYLQLDDHDGHHDGDHHHEHSSAPAFIKHQSPGG